MSMELYDNVSFDLCKTITRKYSTSFSLGIHMLDKKFHAPVYSIYAFVRIADEIVDTFHAHDKENLFSNYKSETFKAIAGKISTNPVLNAFQHTVNYYDIDHGLINAFFRSMEMDLSVSEYNESKYSEYIFGSAEVVGLMCLKVFCHESSGKYESLIVPARKLGSALQKVNFLRDIKSDFHDRGRIYFPGLDFSGFTSEQKKTIENDIQKEFDEAWLGIKKLPDGCRLGVLTACIYYLALFRKIILMPAGRIKNSRIRVNNFEKIYLLVKTWFKYKLNLI